MEFFIIICLVVFVGWALLLHIGKKATEEQKEKDIANGIHARVILEHTAGLPIVEGDKCMLLAYKDRLNITTTAGAEFDLAMSRIVNMQEKTETEIQKTYVSSAGGAVGGALLFGAVGALIGGRVKQKIDTTEHKYLIITYKKNDSLEYLGFDCTNPPLGNVYDLIGYYQKINPCQTVKIDL